MHSRLPSNYHQHCWLMDISNNVALVAVDSADIATALRYQQHELLKQINEEFKCDLNTPLKRIKIKVITPEMPPLNRSGCVPMEAEKMELSKRYCRQILDFLDNSVAGTKHN